MSYAGHVLDMINRMKHNRELQKSRRNASMERRYETLSSNSSGTKKKLTFRKLSPAERSAARMRLRAQVADDRRRMWIGAIVGIIVLLLLVYLVR